MGESIYEEQQDENHEAEIGKQHGNLHGSAAAGFNANNYF